MNRRAFLISTLSSAAPAMLAGQPTWAQTPAPSIGAQSGGTPPDPGVGIIFIGASWCPACKNAAPVLAAMSASTGIPVLVASHDARPIAPFPEFVDARRHAVARQITQFPHTLIFSAATDRIEAEIFGYKNAGHYAGRLRRAILRASGGTG